MAFGLFTTFINDRSTNVNMCHILPGNRYSFKLGSLNDVSIAVWVEIIYWTIVNKYPFMRRFYVPQNSIKYLACPKAVKYKPSYSTYSKYLDLEASIRKENKLELTKYKDVLKDEMTIYCFRKCHLNTSIS
jgi:hypothetical protein